MDPAMPKWFQNAVVYEIYPQSFKDSNGDGIGDLPGIIEKLDYVASLGVNAIWINPCFDSPFFDAGYDVRDFYRVAERYGTNDDLKRLIEEAKKRGIRILLDLVAGHTSIEHPWFQASASAEVTPYDDYFCWTRGMRENQGNYRFVSGMAPRNGFFMINFFFAQPALNYGFSDPDPACPWQQSMDQPGPRKVREELRNVMKFYLDMGCAGFRVDMAASLIKGPDKESRLRGLCDLWGDYKSWMRKNYPEAVLVSEWSDPSSAIPAGFDADFFLNWGYCEPGYRELFRFPKYAEDEEHKSVHSGNCFFCKESSGDSRSFVDSFQKHYDAVKDKGYVSIVTGNHDQIRIRRGKSIEELRLAYFAIFTLPGVPFLYMGDEIGMRYVDGLGNVEGGYHRTGSRTPMQWATGPQAGFSAADPGKFYLPLDPAEDRPTVERQDADADSLLNLTRRLIKLHRSHAALSGNGDYRIVESEYRDAPWIFTRSAEGETFLIALNPGPQTYRRKIALPAEFQIVEQEGTVAISVKNGYSEMEIAPHSGVILRYAEA